MYPASIEKCYGRGPEHLQKFPAPTATDGPPDFFPENQTRPKVLSNKNVKNYPIFITLQTCSKFN
jgi:hypothetical protein